MKSIVEYLNESKNTKFKTNLLKCKTFNKMFCVINGIKNIDEISKDDFDSYDLGFVWFGEKGQNLSFDEFIKKIKTYSNKKVTDINIDDIGNCECVSFNCDDEDFSIDFIDPIYN